MNCKNGFTLMGSGARREKYMSSQYSLMKDVCRLILSLPTSFSCNGLPDFVRKSSAALTVFLHGRE